MIRPLLILLFAAPAACSKARSAYDPPAGTPVYVYQDRPFSYVLESPATGAFTLFESLPSYVAFNATTSTLTGELNTYGQQFSFMTTQARATGDALVGPYRVKLLGNPLKEQQWHLTNTGQKGFAATGGTAGEDIHLTQTIRDGATGAGIKLAVSDSGVVIAHESLKSNVLAGLSRNYFNDPADGWTGDPTPPLVDPENAHGTAVAGLAAAAGWTGVGVRGVAPGVGLAGFLFIPAQSQLATEGVLTAATNDQFDGAFDVFNYSWGESQCYLSQEPASYFTKLAASTSLRSGKGAIFVVAAGNSYRDLLRSCLGTGSGYFYGNANFSDSLSTPYTIIVGALKATGKASSYSSPGANLWISAPGGEYGLDDQTDYTGQPALVTTDFPGCGYGIKSFYSDHSKFNGGSGNPGCGYTNSMNGTSGATPIVSGAIALLLEKYPALTWRDVKYIIARTADQVDPTVNPTSHPNTAANLSGYNYEQGWITNAAGFHFQNYYGFGRINVDAALTYAATYSSPFGTSSLLTGTASPNGSIPDASATGYTSTISIGTTKTVEAVQATVNVSACIGQIGVELTSPSGTKSILMNINSRLQDSSMAQTMLSNAFYGEPSNGTWTLKVVDGTASCTAQLSSWSLKITAY